MEVSMIQGIDLSKTEAFIRKTLTPDQAEQRLKILEAQQEALEPQDEKLSPRSLRELGELAEVLSSDEVLTTVTITRKEPSQFYRVEFQQDPAKARINKFKKLSQEITAVDNSIATGSQLAIVQALVKPQQGMEWYQIATLAQMTALMGTDFLDAMKCGFIADLNLLASARYLYKDPTVYGDILELHRRSYDLYQDQIDFNRDCELNILAHAKITHRCLLEIRESILTCGPKLDTINAEFVDKNKQIVKKEGDQAIILLEAIDKSAGNFLQKLIQLEVGIEKSISIITKASHEVAAIIKQFSFVQKEKQDLSYEQQKLYSEQQNLAAKLSAYQTAEQNRVDSRKVEKVTTYTTETSGWWIFSSTTTTAHTHTIVTEGNFGSAELWKDYCGIKAHAERIQAEANRIEQNVKALEAALKDQIAKHTGAYSNPSEFQEAAGSLAAALAAVKALQSAMRIRQSQAQNQVKAIKYKMLGVEQETIKDISTALYFLEGLRDKLLNSHAIWIQSNKQCIAMQAIRHEENTLRNGLIKDIAEGGSTGLNAIKAAVHAASLENGPGSISQRMITNTQLLEKVSAITQ